MIKFFRLFEHNFAVTLSPSTSLRTGYEMKQNQMSCGLPIVIGMGGIALPTGLCAVGIQAAACGRNQTTNRIYD